MTAEKQAAVAAIEKKADLVAQVADEIWSFAELSLQEEQSADLYCRVLEQEGFKVERGICNIPTAFSASYGSGRPIIGLLAEYDALSGLSQKGGSLTREELVSGGCGHGCGHNLLGAGAMAAALGVKAYLEAAKIPGTVVLYGCPGEEGGAAKAFMARDGLWYGLDAALTWHPDDANEVLTGSSNSCIQTQYHFTGVAAHAAGDPDRGRSALDAVELMNVGVQFLREHMSDKARVHYAITDAGGRSPNVVQPRASVLYMVRSNHVAEAVELQARVDKIAQGAALMTETTVEKKFIDGLADTVTNHALERVLYRNFEALGVPSYTPEELAFADSLAGTYSGSDRAPGVGSQYDLDYAADAQARRAQAGHAMNRFLLPLYQGDAFQPGSTDVGDVSWQCPTAQIHVAAWPNGCPGHSWQNVSCGRTDIGHKAALHAGKVLAAAAIDLLTDPALLEELRGKLRHMQISSISMSQESIAEAIAPSQWWNPFPKTRYTERPDVATASIMEGDVVLMIDNTPSVMLFPCTLFRFAEEINDYYFPPLVGSYLQIVRMIVLLLTLFVTPLWFLLVKDPEKLHESLRFLLIGDEYYVPLILQLLLVELIIDVLKLASLNTPDVLSNSFSMLGALILGDFAVQARWLVPEVLVYMAFVAIANYAQHSYEMGYAVKLCRMALLLLIYFFDWWGFIGGIIGVVAMIASTRPLVGKGYLYPLIPFNGKDLRALLHRRPISRDNT